MTTAEMIKELCEQMNVSVSELARRIGQTPQNFNKKLKRETVTFDSATINCTNKNRTWYNKANRKER